MRRAIISGLHADISIRPKLEESLRLRQVDEIVCLGNVLGPGLQPQQCLDFVRRRCNWSLCGPYDRAIRANLQYRGSAEEQSVLQAHHEALRPSGWLAFRQRNRWKFLGNLPTYREQGACAYFHGWQQQPQAVDGLGVELRNRFIFLMDAAKDLSPTDLKTYRVENFGVQRWLFLGDAGKPGLQVVGQAGPPTLGTPAFGPKREALAGRVVPYGPVEVQVDEWARAFQLNPLTPAIIQVGHLWCRDTGGAHYTILDDKRHCLEFIRLRPPRKPEVAGAGPDSRNDPGSTGEGTGNRVPRPAQPPTLAAAAHPPAEE